MRKVLHIEYTITGKPLLVDIGDQLVVLPWEYEELEILSLDQFLIVAKQWGKYGILQYQWGRVKKLFENDFDRIYADQDEIFWIKNNVYYYLHYTWRIGKFDYIRALSDWFVLFKVSKEDYSNVYLAYDKYYISSDISRPIFNETVEVCIESISIDSDKISAQVYNHHNKILDTVILYDWSDLNLQKILSPYFHNFQRN